jgi:hypothetical protein
MTDQTTDEADRILAGGPIAPALGVVAGQLAVLQSREQLLLTLATLTLTITGFSGPAMVQSGWLARSGLIAGLVCVLAGVLLILATLEARWLTATPGTDRERLVSAIRLRDRKTQVFRWALALLGLGLTCYVAAVVAFIAAV